MLSVIPEFKDADEALKKKLMKLLMNASIEPVRDLMRQNGMTDAQIDQYMDYMVKNFMMSGMSGDRDTT